MVNLVERLCDLKIASLDQQCREQLKSLSERYKQLYGKSSSAYDYLLQKFVAEADDSNLALVPVEEPSEP